jgi:serine/threonine protein kinase
MSTNLIGRILLNQFRVDAFIASGGMGAVYRVWDLKRNVPLAMKVLHADLAEDPSMFKRFKREANALKKLAHPNIVPFYGLYQTTDFAFLLERYVDGPSLKDILRKQQGTPLPVEEVLAYLKALTAALGYAHANGVVHCDVKPGNVMIDQGGSIYLTDFGIARHSDSTTTTLATVGTAAYMAPEQIRGEPVSPATDIYALGVMLYEMLTGQRPFKGDEKGTESSGSTANERIRYAHLNLEFPDPQTINNNIPVTLASILKKSLDKNPSQRFLNAQDLFLSTCDKLGIDRGSIYERIPINQPPAGSPQESYLLSSEKRRALPILSYRFNKLLTSKPVWIVGAAICLILVAVLMYMVLVKNNCQITHYPPTSPVLIGIMIQTETSTFTATPVIADQDIFMTSTPHPTPKLISTPTNSTALIRIGENNYPMFIFLMEIS